MKRAMKIFCLGTLSRKRILVLSHCTLLLVLLAGCNSEEATDCLQTDGEVISRSITLPEFTQVRIDNDVSIEITQGLTQEITIETRANLWSDLSFTVEDNTLIAQNNNDCNIFREFKQTTVHLTTPNLVFIKNNSIGEVRSNGILSFPTLSLESRTTIGLESVNKSGDFILDVSCDTFFVSANGNSDFYITGASQEASINFSDEFPLFQGGEFIVQDLTIRHTGAAPMIVNPQNSITGQIRATGDVIARNQPPVVDVEELFTGKLIFED